MLLLSEDILETAFSRLQKGAQRARQKTRCHFGTRCGRSGMDPNNMDAEILVLASASLLLLLTSNRIVDFEDTLAEEADESAIPWPPPFSSPSSLEDLMLVSRAALHSFRLCNVVTLLGEELGYWVKPRLTAWFSRFLLEQYDEDRWFKMFRMSKKAVFSLTELLTPSIQKKNTKYRLAIPVVIRVACALFKLCTGSSLLICSELFAVGRSSVSMVLRDVVHAVNSVLRSEISWPSGQSLREVEEGFRLMSGLPGVVGAIDATHVTILKPRNAPSDYYYFKSSGYSLNCQAVVDSRKRFLDLFLGMPGSTNDSRVLRRSSLYHRASQNRLWEDGVTFDGFPPYLIGDCSYPLLPWLLVPHTSGGNLALAENLFNAKLKRARTVVENAFGLLKQSFRELLVKSDLDVCFLPDVIVCCALLHNLLQEQSHADVERLLLALRREGFDTTGVREDDHVQVPVEVPEDDEHIPGGLEIRRELGSYLALQRQL